MRKFYLFLSLFLIINANELQAQNDSIYFWKTGVLLEKRSIKTADLDSITFKRPLLTTVTICNQVWATRNLNVSTYSDGTIIPQVTDPYQWSQLSTGAWCYINNDPSTEAVYGKIYNWYAVAGIYNFASTFDPTLRKKLAPTGWHVPTDDEWTTLTTCLGGENVAGGKMKETGTAHWISPNIGATNASGFTGLPGGFRFVDGSFTGIGGSGGWWSRLEYDFGQAWDRSLNNSNFITYRYLRIKKAGNSVRCVRD
jgi:uncharacterized protein (TIGR02145 family)